MAGPPLADVLPYRKQLALCLLWLTGACGPPGETPAPDSAVVADPASLRPGLRLELQGEGPVLTGQLAIPSFSLSPQESLHPALGPEFTATWSGLVEIQESGRYRFHCDSSLIELGGVQACTGELKLTDGFYSIRVLYSRRPGRARFRLQWESDHFAPEPLPLRFLFHRPLQAEGEDRIQAGRDLVVDLKCTGCHATQSPRLQSSPAPPLSRHSPRLKAPWLLAWLQAPAELRPHTRMPGLSLDPQEAHHLVSLLASSPDRDQPWQRRGKDEIQRGGELFSSIGCHACHSSPESPLEDLSDKTSLSHLVEYLEDPASFHPEGAMPDFLLNRVEARQLAGYLMRNPPSRPALPSHPPGDPEQGLELLTQKGCLACHTFQDGSAAANPMAGPELHLLAAEQGCLADSVAAELPDYRLNRLQRDQIRRFLDFHRSHPDMSPAPIHDYYEEVRRLRCNRCHTIDHLTSTADLAERVPELTDVGAKLTPEWLRQVLQQEARVRDWLQVRMPHFSSSGIETLPAGMAQASGLSALPARSSRLIPQTAVRGLQMIGSDEQEGGQNCLRCHDWGTYRAHGEGAPQLALAGQRLRREWYRRFMSDPSRVIPGTSMPSFLEDDPSSKRQGLAAIWSALMVEPHSSEAESVLHTRRSPPQTLIQHRDTPQIVRWDLPDATAAAIAVSFPSGLSYAFDAGLCRLLYVWEGGFLRLGQSLTRKVDKDHVTPTAQLHGDILYRAPQTPISSQAPGWSASTSFLGYRLVDGVPRLHYRIGPSQIQERILPLPDVTGVRREFRIESPLPLQLDLGVGPGFSVRTSLQQPRNGLVEIPAGTSTFQVEIRMSNGGTE